MTKKLLTVVLIVGFVMVGAPGLATAQETDDDEITTESLAEQIQELLILVQQLQNQLAEIRGQAQDVRTELRETRQLTRQLARGMSGDDVTELQELLATDPEIYPEGLVTGFFGPLTEQAVERFQARVGLEQVGNVGPQTLSRINQILEEGVGPDGHIPPGLLRAPGIQSLINGEGFTPPGLGGVTPGQGNDDESESEDEDDDEDDDELEDEDEDEEDEDEEEDDEDDEDDENDEE